jgi:hypothetical protein
MTGYKYKELDANWQHIFALRNDEEINDTFKRSYFALSQLSFEANSKPI